MRPAADYSTLESRHSGIRRVLAIVLVFNITVVLAKAVAGIMTSTLSVLAEAMHSSVDALNNVIGLALARVAARAPDERHPYGHAKFETLGALAVVAFLIRRQRAGVVDREVTGPSTPSADGVDRSRG